MRLELHVWRTPVICRPAAHVASFSADAATFLSCSADKTLKLWRTTTGECLQTLSGRGLDVQACAFAADGRLCVSGSSDASPIKLKVWTTAPSG